MFDLSRDFKRPRFQGLCDLMVDTPCGRRDVKYLIFHVPSSDQMFRGFWTLWVKAPYNSFATFPSLVGIGIMIVEI